jgi:type IV pilus assembly protein PilQ
MNRSLAVALLLPLLAVTAAFAPNTDGRITGLRLEPNSGQTELTIQFEGAGIEWDDFTLANPSRIVLDFAGARNELPESRYERINRGGIMGVRVSQYSEDVVRVVLDVDRASRYTVSRAPDGVRISISGGGAFESWSAGSAPSARPAAAVRPATPAVRTERRITVTFQDADIRDVLASFAEFTGRSIVPGGRVQGSVTAEIRNQPWDVALETILGANGLAAREMPSGIIRVDAFDQLRERETQEPLATQTYRINYVPVQELVATLATLKSERGNVVANSSTNTLIVTDVESVLSNMGQMVRQLDIQTPQVAIQAKIIFVNRTNVEELGVTYDLKDSRVLEGRGNSLNRLVSIPDPRNPGEFTNENLITLGGNSIAALGNATARVVGPSLETIISLVMGRYTLITFLDALQAAELSDVQAAPLITTLDNQEAEIWVGERTPIRVVDVGSGAVGAQPRATAQLVETGIRLRVTPTITGDRRVLMQLHAERSAAQLAATDIGVTFQQQQGTTRLLVRDGETAVIGGLTVTEVASSRAGIPVLMDIPFVGALFRTTRTREQKRDLLILVTPHIVDDRG